MLKVKSHGGQYFIKNNIYDVLEKIIPESSINLKHIIV